MSEDGILIQPFELKEHYVYELRDPDNNDEVFYVGKGTGRRIDHHEKEAERSLDHETAKLVKIRAIEMAGKKPIKIVIGRFDTAAEAFAVEATLIHWIYGHKDQCLTKLTNVKGGHGVDYIRPRDNEFEELPDIDVDRERSNDGTYTKEQVEKNERNEVERKLSSLRNFIIERHKDWQVSAVNLSRPKSPSIIISASEIVNIHCVMRNTSTGALALVIRSAENSKADIEKFRVLVESLGKVTNGIKNYPNFPYVRFVECEPSISIDDMHSNLKRIEVAWKILNGERG